MHQGRDVLTNLTCSALKNCTVNWSDLVFCDFREPIHIVVDQVYIKNLQLRPTLQLRTPDKVFIIKGNLKLNIFFHTANNFLYCNEHLPQRKFEILKSLKYFVFCLQIWLNDF